MSAGFLPVRPAVDSPLGRRNPTVKLGVLLLVSCVVLFVVDPVTPAVLYLLALLAVVVSTGVPPRVLALAHLPFLAFAAGVLGVNALSRGGEVMAAVGPLTVTDSGLAVGAALAGRTLLIGVLSIGFLVSTDPVVLITSLHQHARLGPRATYALLAGYRMLEELPREWQTIRDAQRVRSGADESGWRAWRRAGFALLVVTVRKGQRMSLALESRGVGLRPRTTWRPVPLDRADLGMAAGVLATLALVIVTSGLVGTLEGVGALESTPRES